MKLLPSLRSDSNVAIVGASGGIGLALVELLAADEGVRSIHAISRSSVPLRAGNVHGHQLDLNDEASIEAAAVAASSDDPLDLVVVASGILHRGDELQPEKSMRELNAKSLNDVLSINTIGPALVAKHFLPRLRHHGKTVFVALSARVGSIGDNRLGGWTSYRVSKAALNMLVRTFAIEHARRFPESIVVSLHPGTVATPLSRPYTSRVDASRLFSPADAAAKIVGVVDRLEPEMTGGFFAYDGSWIEF